jgi:hypothetical protein
MKTGRQKDKRMTYSWTVDSAVWQVTHGGPTHRTLSAIQWGNQELCASLLEALVDLRGLQNLGDALAPLPDETETLNEFATGE